jgi:hypothetical protein
MGFVIVSQFIYLFPRASAAASGGVCIAPSSRSVKRFCRGFSKLVDWIWERLLFFGLEAVVFSFQSAFCYPRKAPFLQGRFLAI